MCKLRNKAKKFLWSGKGKPKVIHVDACMEKLLNLFIIAEWKVLGCCCGHHKYPMSVVVKNKDGFIFDYISNQTIPRKNRFYIKDKNGYYYIPEAVKYWKEMENEKLN